MWWGIADNGPRRASRLSSCCGVIVRRLHYSFGVSVARLQELLAKKASLDREIAETQRKERSSAIEHIRTLMEQYGIVAADLSGRGKRRGRPPATVAAKTSTRSSKLKGKKVAPKFRNKATGETWSGRGLKPKWLAAALASGKKLSDFAV